MQSSVSCRMRFAVAAIAAIAWSIVALRWSISRRGSPWRHRAVMVAIIALAAAILSIVSDWRSIQLRLRMPRSGVTIHIDEIGDWWRLTYERDGMAFVTANELHVPAGTIVTLDCRSRPVGAWSAHDFLSLGGRSSFIAETPGVDRALLIRLFPPSRRHLRIVADPAPDFERWFANELRPAATVAASDLFVSSGCSYCHVIRGVAEDPSTIAPDLTHFGARRTIGAMDMPNRRGFLSGWIVDSHALKHGSEMPDNRLNPPVLHKLVSYLETLR